MSAPDAPLLIAACTALVLALGAGGSSSDGGASQAASDIGEDCADCHPSIVASYRETGMARALGPVVPGELHGLAGVVEKPTGFRYHFEQDAAGARIVEMHERASDEEGLAATVVAPLSFAIGAGILDRSYAAVRGRTLWFAPLEVISAHGDAPRHAALSPVLEIEPGKRFDAAITGECLACHTDLLPPREFPLNLVAEDAGWKPRGISCGACHGDVDGHVAARRKELEEGGEVGEDPILSLDSLGRYERLSVCAACHLQGDARIELDKDSLGPPPPGGDLLQGRAVFVAREPNQDIGFVSHVQRMVLSRCFTESADLPGGGLACGTCHDPHRSLTAPAERARVRAACSSCHASDTHGESTVASACAMEPARRPAGADCVSCHMRRTAVFDVAEVSIHDHYIRTEPGPPSSFEHLRAHEAEDGDVARFLWPHAEAPDHAQDAGLRMMAAFRMGKMDRALSLAGEEPGRTVRRLPMYHHVRGLVMEHAGQFEEARLAYKRALILAPTLAESSINLALVLGRLGQEREGITLLTSVLERHPWAHSALRNRALLHAQIGDQREFERDLEAAYFALPDGAVARALAAHYAERGAEEQAERWRREARRIDPLQAP